MRKQILMMIMMTLLASGFWSCAGILGKARESKPEPAAAAPSADAKAGMSEPTPFYAEIPNAEGSLWNQSAALLFVDQKARRVGDTIVVDIVENTSSQMDVNTSTSKETTLQTGVSNALGYMRWLEGNNSNLNSGGNKNLLSWDFSNGTKGAGSSDRSGQVSASIGARIIDVLPNGNLHIYGKRQMQVNDETQVITVSGVARPEDIGQDNRVESTYLADARIEYSGKGVLADKQSPGWMTQIVDKVWPF